jgi:Tfp pilus assembly protein PilO
MSNYITVTLIAMAAAAFGYHQGWLECMRKRRADRLDLWDLETEYRIQKEKIARLEDQNWDLRVVVNKAHDQLRDRVRPKLP